MYLEMKKTYIGKTGTTFPKGIIQEVTPDRFAKKLIKDGYAIECRAPWNKHKNDKLAENEVLLAQEAKLGKQVEALTRQLAHAQQVADNIPAIKNYLAEVEEKHKAVLKQLESFDKGKKDAKTNTESESSDHTDETDTEQKGDSDNAAGQAAPTGQTQE